MNNVNLSPVLVWNQELLMQVPSNPLSVYYSNPENRQRIVSECKASIPKAAFVAGLAGGILGALVGYFRNKSEEEIALHAAAGGILGASLVTGYKIYQTRISITQDQGYLNWRESIEAPVLERFDQFIEATPLREFKCCLMQTFPRVAAKDAFGRVYDRAILEKWVREKGTNPFTREPMTLNDILPYDQYPKEFAEIFEQVINRDIHVDLTSPETIVTGLKNALNSALISHNNNVLARARAAQKIAEEQGLTPSEVDATYQHHRANYIEIPVEPRPDGVFSLLTMDQEDLKKFVQSIVETFSMKK